MGLEIPEEYIFTPPRAAIACMKNTGRDHFHLITTGDVDQEFTGPGTGTIREKLIMSLSAMQEMH